MPLAILFTSYSLNTFRTLVCPPSGACDYAVELPHRSFPFCKDGGFSVSVNVWCLAVCVDLHVTPNTTLTLNPPSLQNETTDVVIQQHSRKLLMMDILMYETC